MEHRYDILQFHWNKKVNTFYADAWGLVAIMPDGSVHPESFPNQKKQFFIHNYKTNGFRRFKFISEIESEWLFESEDGIQCRICIEP